MLTKSGTCLCGSVKVSLKLEKAAFDVCHCGMCRKWGGGPLFTVDASAGFTIKGEEFVTAYASSQWAERGFCRKCGTHLFYRLKDKSYMNFPMGLFEDQSDFKFTSQIFIDSKPTCYEFANKTETLTEAQVMATFGPPPA